MGVPVFIRPETEADIPAIDRINLDAFQNHPYSHRTEHLIVRPLRASGALTLSLLADPACYARFGFRHIPSLRIHEVPPEYVMCLPFSGDIPGGLVTHHPAFFTTA